jgi:hypothetical protein
MLSEHQKLLISVFPCFFRAFPWKLFLFSSTEEPWKKPPMNSRIGAEIIPYDAVQYC